MNIRDIIIYLDSLDPQTRAVEYDILSRLYGSTIDEDKIHAYTEWTLSPFPNESPWFDCNPPDRQNADIYDESATEEHKESGITSMVEYQGPYRRTDGHLYYVHAHTGMVVAADTLEQCYLDPRYKEQYLDPRTGQHRFQQVPHSDVPAVKIEPGTPSRHPLPLPVDCMESTETQEAVLVGVKGTQLVYRLPPEDMVEWKAWWKGRSEVQALKAIASVGLFTLSFPVNTLPANHMPLVVISRPCSDPIADVLHVHEALSPMPSGAMRWKLTKEGYDVLDRYQYMGLKEKGFEYIVRPYEKGGEEEMSQECRWLASMVEAKLEALYTGATVVVESEDVGVIGAVEPMVGDFTYNPEVHDVDADVCMVLYANRQAFYDAILEFDLIDVLKTRIHWVRAFKEGSAHPKAITFMNHLRLFAEAGGKVGVENGNFYVSY